MPKIQRHILKHIAPILRLRHQRVHQIAQVAFILRLRFKHLAGHFHDVGIGVVAGAGQLDEFCALRVCEVGEVADAEFEDDFFLGRVRFAHVGCVAEAEGGVEGGGVEGFG